MINAATFRSSSEIVDSWIQDIGIAIRALKVGDLDLAFGFLLKMWWVGKVSGAAEEIAAATEELAGFCDVVIEWPMAGESCEFASAHEVALELRKLIYCVVLAPLKPESPPEILHKWLTKVPDLIYCDPSVSLPAYIKQERARAIQSFARSEVQLPKPRAKKTGRRRRQEQPGDSLVIGAIFNLLKTQPNEPPTGKAIVQVSGIANVSRFIRKHWGSMAVFKAHWRRGLIQRKLFQLMGDAP